MSNERTNFDSYMNSKYNPMAGNSRENYNAPPFPTPRTIADKRLQQKWCSDCNNLRSLRHSSKVGHHHSSSVESYNFRTQFDQNLQKKWCSC